LALPFIACSTSVARSTHAARDGSHDPIDFAGVLDAITIEFGSVNITAALQALVAGNPNQLHKFLGSSTSFRVSRFCLAREVCNVLLIFSADSCVDEVAFLDAYKDAETDFGLIESVAASSGNPKAEALACTAVDDLNKGNAAINDVINSILSGEDISDN
jgi:hypothetical protein